MDPSLQTVVDELGDNAVYDEEGDVTFACSTGTPEDQRFDAIVGIIEELIVDDAFARIRENFFKANCVRFEKGDENPHHYKDIHKEYIDGIEAYIERFITSKSPGFSMPEFLQSLAMRKEEVTGDVWDLLTTATDFLLFKEMMLSYKAAIAVECVGIIFTVVSVQLWEIRVIIGTVTPRPEIVPL